MVPSFPPMNPKPKMLRGRTVAKAQSHAAESESRDLQIAAPKFALLHFVLLFGARAGLVLLVGDLFHPVDRLAVELLHNGDVRHGRDCRGAVPMLLTRRAPDHVTGADLSDRASPALNQAAPSRDDQ